MNIALNISNNRLQVVAIKGRRVKKWASLPLPEEVVRDGLILKPQALGEAIDRFFRAHKIPRDHIVASLSGLSFTYRFIKLPRMKPELVEEAILRAAKKEISLPLEELYLVWQPLPGGENAAETEYFVLGVPRHLVDALAATLHAADLTPAALELCPLALARAAARSQAIAVNMDADSFDIVIVAGGIPRVIHSIAPRGGDATLEDNIRRLADELTKTVAFYQGSQPEGQLDAATPLLLSGELAAEAAATGLLQTEVNYPVELLAPPVEVPPQLALPAYAASIGLALPRTNGAPDSPYHDIGLNILNGRHRKAKKPPRSPLLTLLAILLGVAVVGIYPLYHARADLIDANAAASTELDNISREITLAGLAATEAAQQEASTAATAAAASTRQAANAALLAPRGSFTADLALVTDNLPLSADFTAVTIGTEQITVTGQADSTATVVAYAAALEASGAFAGVRIARLDEAPPPEDGTAAGITFEIDLTR